nr:tetratricopeptide repeat protein [Oceanococcus sp. HetDA_MAG_MS8]
MSKTRSARRPAATNPNLQQAIQLYSQGQFAACLNQIQTVLGSNPENGQAWHIAAAAAFAMQHHQDAELLWRTAIEKAPRLIEAHYNLGVLLYQTQRREEAAAAWEKTLKLAPKHTGALNNLGALMQEAGRYTEAEKAFRRALAADARNAQSMNNLAVLLLERQNNSEAESLLARAVALAPKDPDLLNNLGRCLARRRADDEAEAHYRRALDIDPEHADSRWGLGLLRLAQGDFAEGWPLYEARYHANKTRRNVIPPSLPFPQWQGEDLRGKRLLVMGEQGFGDQIQFARYLTQIKQSGASYVGLATRQALLPLLRTVEGVDQLYALESTTDYGSYDAWAFCMSLPLHCQTRLSNIPATQPYLRSLPERRSLWEPRLPSAGLRIGLVWAGNPQHENDANRSLPAAALVGALRRACPQAQLISLQAGVSADPSLALDEDFGPLIADFADTAAIVDQLDLVVCVDTAIAHLCGALGRPCFVLLPYLETDWRWLRDGTTNPWYPQAMRILRQDKAQQWEGVLRELEQALVTFQPEQRSEPSYEPSSAVNPDAEALLQAAVNLIPAGARVCALDSLATALERQLPWGAQLQGTDAPQTADMACLLSGLPNQPESLAQLKTFAELKVPLLFSPGPEASQLMASEREALQQLGYDTKPTATTQPSEAKEPCLLKLYPKSTSLPRVKKVHVLSFFNVGNFGDRLGFHLLSEMLPGHVQVSWGSLRPLQAPPPDCDLLILGIGNSLFGDLLSDELLEITQRVPTIGIFGTQYRDSWPATRLQALIGNLEHWYARYEEDLLLYGRGHSHVSHLGDWLIRAFPLRQAERKEQLVIDQKHCAEPAMDRLIQHIQSYQQVHSTRLHPLLCALTSAQRVSYSEQHESSETPAASGKFRSMLMDVFGRHYPENTLFTVDRDAVLAYRQQVQQRCSELQEHLHHLLRAGA